MQPLDSLPVLLVGASTEADAIAFINELIDDDVTSEVVGAEAAAGGARVWRLLNKYYRAYVRVCAHVYTQPLPFTHCEAYLLYLPPHECTAAGVERVRQGPGAQVRVVVCDVVEPALALLGAAAAVRADLVPLRGPAGTAGHEHEQEGPFREEHGAAGARAALHAHVWPGLARVDRPDAGLLPDLGDLNLDGDSSGDENGFLSDEECSEEESEESMLRRAEQFASLLEALPAARVGAGAGAGQDEHEDEAGREARRERAEALLREFLRALGPAPL